MKKNIIIALVVVGVIGIFYFTTQNSVSDPTSTTQETSNTTNTQRSPTGQDSQTAGVSTYSLIPAESSIKWSAGKPAISGYTHTGTIGLTSGSLIQQPTGYAGTFVIDMNSIKITSLGGGKVGKESALEGHLKGDDFFSATTFPTGTFTVNSITSTGVKDSYIVKGDLTLKGKTNPVEFPAVMTQVADGKITAQGSVDIDRTKWDITYGSGSFFSNLADNAIDNTIKLSLTLVAK